VNNANAPTAIRAIQEGKLWALFAEQWESECKAYKTTFLYRGGSATSSAVSFTEKLEAKRARRKREKLACKPKKSRNQDELFRAATQNFNGNGESGEEKTEEAASNIKLRKLGVVFGQEGRRCQNKIERWDAGELLLPAVRDRPRGGTI
jgi:hypothetical protein